MFEVRKMIRRKLLSYNTENPEIFLDKELLWMLKNNRETFMGVSLNSYIDEVFELGESREIFDERMSRYIYDNLAKLVELLLINFNESFYFMTDLARYFWNGESLDGDFLMFIHKLVLTPEFNVYEYKYEFLTEVMGNIHPLTVNRNKDLINILIDDIYVIKYDLSKNVIFDNMYDDANYEVMVNLVDVGSFGHKHVNYVIKENKYKFSLDLYEALAMDKLQQFNVIHIK